MKRSFLIWMPLTGLAVLPLGRAFSLGWVDLVLLLIITPGLLYLSRGWGRPDHPGGGGSYLTGHRRAAALLLALLFIFILVHFDPGFHSEGEPAAGGWNWFSIASSALVLLGLAAMVSGAVVRGRGQGESPQRRGRPWSLSATDRFVVVALGGAILLGLLSRLIVSGEALSRSGTLWAIKLGEGLILWFLVKGLVLERGPHLSVPSAPVSGVQRWTRLQLAVICAVFSLLLVAGLLRSVVAVSAYRRGSARMSGGQIQEAEQHFLRAERLARSMDLRLLQVKALQQLSLVNIEAGALDRVQELLEQMEGVAGGGAGVLEVIGDVHMAMESWREAAKQYLKVLKERKGSERVLTKLAWCFIRLEDLAGLKRLVERRDFELSIVPEDARTALLLGRYDLSQGQVGEALTKLRMAEQFDPGDAEVKFWLGLLLQKTGRWQESADYLRDVLSEDADFFEARYLLATALEMMGRTDEAISHFSLLLDRAPHDSNLLIVLERLYRLQGRDQEALQMQGREHRILAGDMEGAGEQRDRDEVYLWSNASLAAVCQLFPGEVKFDVVARGASPFQTRPDEIPGFDPTVHLVVWLDEERLGEADVPLGQWTTHSFAARASSWEHQLRLEFTNDFYQPEERKDRNLVLQKVIVHNMGAEH